MKIEVYGAEYCGACKRAKKILTEKGLDFEYKDLALVENQKEFVERLPGVKSIPQVFMDDEHVGGCDDMSERLG